MVLTIELIPVNPMKPVESWSAKTGFSFILFFLVSSDAISLAEKNGPEPVTMCFSLTLIQQNFLP